MRVDTRFDENAVLALGAFPGSQCLDGRNMEARTFPNRTETIPAWKSVSKSSRVLSASTSGPVSDRTTPLQCMLSVVRKEY